MHMTHFAKGMTDAAGGVKADEAIEPVVQEEEDATVLE